MASIAESGRRSLGQLVMGALVALVMGMITIAGWSVLRIDPRVSGVTLMLLWLNVFILLIAIAVECGRRPYSLHLFHLLALFFFLGAASLLQYSVGRLAVAGRISDLQSYILPAVVAVTLWILSYLAAYELTHRFVPGERGAMSRVLNRSISLRRSLILQMAGIGTIAYLGAIGLAGIATRGAAEESLKDLSAQRAGYSGLGVAFYLIHNLILRAFPLIALSVAFLCYRRAPRASRPFLAVVTLGLFAGNLFANNPFASNRMWFAGTLFGLLSPLVLIRFRTGWAAIVATTAGISVLPALNLNRYAATFSEFMQTFQVSSPIEYLSRSSDVDSLGMLTLTIKWVDTEGYRYGMQLLGAVFSWVPRVIWPTKPIGTGRMVTQDLGFSFTNLSPPVVAEAYVDFGYVGVLAIAVLVGMLLARLDRIRADVPVAAREELRIIDVMLPFWLICVVFLTRGDMFAAVAFTAAFTIWLLPLAAGAPLPGRNRSANPPAR